MDSVPPSPARGEPGTNCRCECSATCSWAKKKLARLDVEDMTCVSQTHFYLDNNNNKSMSGIQQRGPTAPRLSHGLRVSCLGKQPFAPARPWPRARPRWHLPRSGLARARLVACQGRRGHGVAGARPSWPRPASPASLIIPWVRSAFPGRPLAGPADSHHGAVMFFVHYLSMQATCCSDVLFHHHRRARHKRAQVDP